MIVRGALEETHKKRLASLDRPGHVHVMPPGALSSRGFDLFKAYARTFKRHNFYMALRGEYQDPGILKEFMELTGPNVHTLLLTGDTSGTEISRWHTRMEKRITSDSALGS